MEQPLITLLCKEQAAEAALNGSSARKAPQGEAAKRLTIFALLCASTMRQGEAAKRLIIFAEKMKFTEFFFRQGEDMQRPLQSAEADSFPDGEAGNAG